jgi:hypothetical protein
MSALGLFVNGKTIVRLDVGRPAGNTGSFRGYIDNLAPINQLNSAGISDNGNQGGAGFDNACFSYSAQAAARGFNPGGLA